jgi:hypothetical protein
MNIYDLKLHEKIRIGDFTIYRLPGGWIYQSMIWDGSIFIPYNDEFKEATQ